MIILYIFAALCLYGFVLIIKDSFAKHPPLTPEEEEKQQKRMDMEHRRDVKKLRDTAKDLSSGATIVGLGLLNEVLKSNGRNKKGS